MQNNSLYIGRFAPSPSGPLHLGSLSTALASYLHARQNDGKWLVRLEDIDTPRCVDGADNAILESLSAHGLQWDDKVEYQSQRLAHYQQVLSSLKTQTYPCDCTRAMIKQRGGSYDGHCRNRSGVSSPHAIRLRNTSPIVNFSDGLLGDLQFDTASSREDFVLKRRDGLFAYHLVVVCDDIAQQVTDIVRGADLLETSLNHLSLYAALGASSPRYWHLPVLSSSQGMKLSKQNHAPAINNSDNVQNLHRVLRYLGFSIPKNIDLSSVSATMDWAIANAKVTDIRHQREIIVENA